MPPGPAATIGTLCISGNDVPHKHNCPGCWGGSHVVTGPISTGSPTVIIGGKPAARGTDQGNHAACCGSPPGSPNYMIVAASCSPTVKIGGLPAARAEDQTLHCGSMVGKIDRATCYPTVMIA